MSRNFYDRGEGTHNRHNIGRVGCNIIEGLGERILVLSNAIISPEKRPEIVLNSKAILGGSLLDSGFTLSEMTQTGRSHIKTTPEHVSGKILDSSLVSNEIQSILAQGKIRCFVIQEISHPLQLANTEDLRKIIPIIRFLQEKDNNGQLNALWKDVLNFLISHRYFQYSGPVLKEDLKRNGHNQVDLSCLNTIEALQERLKTLFTH